MPPQKKAACHKYFRETRETEGGRIVSECKLCYLQPGVSPAARAAAEARMPIPAAKVVLQHGKKAKPEKGQVVTGHNAGTGGMRKHLKSYHRKQYEECCIADNQANYVEKGQGLLSFASAEILHTDAAMLAAMVVASDMRPFSTFGPKSWLSMLIGFVSKGKFGAIGQAVLDREQVVLKNLVTIKLQVIMVRSVCSHWRQCQRPW